MKIENVLKFGAVAAALCLSAGAHAAASYCSVTGSPNTDGLSLSDVTYMPNYPSTTPTNNANDCYGIVVDDPATKGNGNNEGNDSVEAINALKWADPVGTANDFVLLDKSDSSTGASLLGLTWTVTAPANPTTGVYTLTSSAPFVPAQYFDFVVVLKASDAWAAYFFDEAKFDGSAGGGWSVKINNNGGQLAGLSHMSVYGRGGSTPPDETVPEPSSLALAGLALLGLGWARRRRT